MKVIFKYDLAIGETRTHALPRGARVLHVGKQSINSYRVWILHDNSAEDMVSRSFTVVGTGWALDDSKLEYVGTIVDGSFVWHVFAAEEKEIGQ